MNPAMAALVEKLRRDLDTRNLSAEQSITAADCFLTATARDHWSNKTQAARDQWLSDFESAVDNLLELMSSAPTPPKAWGFPARDNVLMNVASRWGLELPPSDDVIAFFGRMRDLERAADAELWTLADSLNHYRDQQRTDCEAPQVLKRPADVKAGRAEFIVNFRKATGLSAEVVARVASVLFEEQIDPRVVRRLTRTDLPRS